MRTERDRAQLRSIIQSPQWKTIVALAEELCAKIKDEPILHDTEWKTLSEAIVREGKIRGIQDLLQSAEREAFQDKNAERDESA